MSLLLDALKQAEKSRNAEASSATQDSNLIKLETENFTADQSALAEVALGDDSSGDDSAKSPPLANRSDPSPFAEHTDPGSEPKKIAPPKTVKSAGHRAAAQNLFQAGLAGTQAPPRPSMFLTLIAVLFLLLFIVVLGLYSFLTGDSVITEQAAQSSVSRDLSTPEITTLLPIAEPLIAPPEKKVEPAVPAPAPQIIEAERNPLPISQAVTPSIEDSYLDNSRPGVTEVKFKRKTVTNQHQQQLQKAQLALELGNYPQAKLLYRSLLSGGAEDKNPRFGLAAIAMKEAHFEEARAQYSWILSLEPNNPFAKAGLADASTENSPLKKEAILKQQISQQENSSFLHYSLGNFYVSQQRWEDAQKAYFTAFDLDPSNAIYAFNLAISLEQLGQGKSALGFYRQALQLVMPNDPIAVTDLQQRIGYLEKQQ